MSDQKKGQPNKASPEKSPVQNTSINAQNARLVARLEQSPVDTFTIMRELNICRPGARVCDLRNAGYTIHTQLITLEDEWGRKHPKIALYTLLAAPGKVA